MMTKEKKVPKTLSFSEVIDYIRDELALRPKEEIAEIFNKLIRTKMQIAASAPTGKDQSGFEVIFPGYLTKIELMKWYGKGKETFDYALPQEWVDKVYNKVKDKGFTYQDITSGFVWLYDKKGGVYGRPYPLTPPAIKLFDLYIKRSGGEL